MSDVKEWKLVPVEPTAEMIEALAAEVFPDDNQAGKALQRMRGCDVVFPKYEIESAVGKYNRMLATAPVPPAGGEVEVFSMKYGERPTEEDGQLIRHAEHIAIVTRLQAEVETHKFHAHCHLQRAQQVEKERDALKAERNDLIEGNDALHLEIADLNSDLTTAREYISDACEIITRLKSEGWGQGVDVEMEEYLEAHQSAPAGKE